MSAPPPPPIARRCSWCGKPDDHSHSRHRVIYPPLSLTEYGFRDGAPIAQPGSPSGFLLPWQEIDEVARERSGGGQRFEIIGETIRDDGIRFPEVRSLIPYPEADKPKPGRRSRWKPRPT